MKIQLPKTEYAKTIVTPYHIADNPAHVWGYTQCLHESWTKLAQVCVQIGPQYWIKSPHAGWCAYTDKLVAKRELFNSHGDAVGCKATKPACNEFIDHGVAAFQGMVLLPGAAEFCRLHGKPVLNTWEDRRLIGDTDDIDAALPLLQMLARNLCGEDMASMEDLSAAILNKAGSFAYLIHFLASIFQQPGRHIGTTVFLMTGQGMGKGTLAHVMKALLGGYVNLVNADELRRGWNSCIDGALLSVWDEFKSTRGDGLYTRVKQYVGNDTLSISRKNLEAITVPNITNHLFFSNNLYPIFVDADDRRISFIGGSRNTSHKSLSSQVFTTLKAGGNGASKMLSGFSAFLSQVEVNREWISKPLQNQYRTDVINVSRSPVEAWFAMEAYNWVPGAFRTMDELWQSFRMWTSLYDSNPSIRSRDALGRLMGARLVSAGYVQRCRQQGHRGYVLRQKPPYVEAGDQQTKLSAVKLSSVDELLSLRNHSPV